MNVVLYGVLILFLLAVALVVLDILIFSFDYWYSERVRRINKDKNWIASTFGNEVHILPQKDLMVHLANDCSCSPKRYPVGLPDGTTKWQVVHNALDGRDRLP